MYRSRTALRPLSAPAGSPICRNPRFGCLREAFFGAMDRPSVAICPRDASLPAHIGTLRGPIASMSRSTVASPRQLRRLKQPARQAIGRRRRFSAISRQSKELMRQFIERSLRLTDKLLRLTYELRRHSGSMARCPGTLRRQPGTLRRLGGAGARQEGWLRQAPWTSFNAVRQRPPG